MPNAYHTQKELKFVLMNCESDSDERVRRNMQVSLAKKISERGSRFRTLQKEYLFKLQGQKVGANLSEVKVTLHNSITEAY